MSTDRQALAAAASTVDGISCTEHFRQSLKAGDAGVRWDADRQSSNGFGYMTTWQVVVWLPADQVAAEKFVDNHKPALMAALAEEGEVTIAQAVQWETQNGLAKALVVEVVRGTEE